MNTVRTLHTSRALLSTGWAENVRITLGEPEGRPDGGPGSGQQCAASDGEGRITAIQANAVAEPDDLVLANRALLPAPVNLHSHAFQRALAGLTEYRSTSQDSFWSWRDLMYRFVEQLDPDDIEDIAAAVQMEMLEAGYAACGEFHYLHHQADGTPHDDVAEMAVRIAASASITGIGLTLLPVFYQRGGLDGRDLSGGQLRFGCSRDLYEKLIVSAANAVAKLNPDCNLGVAPHSLRAVSSQDLSWVTALLPDAPVHIHIAEQTAEVDEVAAVYGAPPVRWLLDNATVDQRWCLVHATHMTSGEASDMARSGAVAGLCPITESNLGDGIFSGLEYLTAGGKIGIGSDSNVRIAMAEELRTLEYSQRLKEHQRAVLVDGEKSVGRTLFGAVAEGGARATGRSSGRIEVGQLADLVAIDTGATHTMGLTGDRLLDAWIFAGDDRLVTDVFSAGRHVVREGRHIHHGEISRNFNRVVMKLRAGL